MSGTTTRDRIIADAKSVPDLIARAKISDPDLAASLTPKALAASRTIWGTAISMIVSWAVSHWALGWGADDSALVSGLITIGVTAAFRYVTRSPIGGVLQSGQPAPVPAAPTGPAA